MWVVDGRFLFVVPCALCVLYGLAMIDVCCSLVGVGIWFVLLLVAGIWRLFVVFMPLLFIVACRVLVFVVSDCCKGVVLLLVLLVGVDC